MSNQCILMKILFSGKNQEMDLLESCEMGWKNSPTQHKSNGSDRTASNRNSFNYKSFSVSVFGVDFEI